MSPEEREQLLARMFDIVDRHLDDVSGWAGAEPKMLDLIADVWDEGVATALNHAIRNDDGITLRLEHLDGRPWVNPYRETPEGEFG